MYVVKNLKTNGTTSFETRLDVVQWIILFEDIYEDSVWDKFIELHSKTYEIKRVDNELETNDDEMETIDDEKVYEFLNRLNLTYKGKEIYFGSTKEFCRDYNILEYDYYDCDWYSKDLIKLPKNEFNFKDLKIMFLVKNLETNQTMQFETLEDVAEWFNFSEDLYADGVWDKFIEQNSKNYEIRRIVYYISADIKVDKNFPIKNKEDDDDLPF